MANIFSQIGNLVRNIASGRAFIGAGFQRTNIWGVGAQEIYSPIEAETAIQKGFEGNTAVYSIIKKDAKKFGSIERYLENVNEDKPIEKHPLLDLLKRPNPHQGQDAFFALVRAFYKTCGEAFVWLNRGDVTQAVGPDGLLIDRTPQQYLSQPVEEMYVIPSNHIVVVPSPDDPFDVIGYKLRDRPDIKFRKEDIIHWKDLNLEWSETGKPHLRGMPALKPGFKTLQADNSAIDSMVRMFQNDGAKGVLVNEEIGKMNPKIETQVRDVINNKVNNKEIKNAVAALEGKWTYIDLGLTSVDMETLKGREFIYKEFCFLFGVPYALFDSQVTFDNQLMAQKGWVLNEIKPDSLQFDGELNRMLLPAFGLAKLGTNGQLINVTAEICSNFDNLEELQESKQRQIEWIQKAPISPNEAREVMGYEARPEPEMDDIYLPSGFMPITDPVQNDPNQIMNDVNAMSDAARGTKPTNGTYAGANRANGQ